MATDQRSEAKLNDSLQSRPPTQPSKPVVTFTPPVLGPTTYMHDARPPTLRHFFLCIECAYEAWDVTCSRSPPQEEVPRRHEAASAAWVG